MNKLFTQALVEMKDLHDMENKKLKCDMTKECPEEVTHIDEKGFLYCARHGYQRKNVMRCRKLRPAELKRILENQPIKKF